MAGCSHPHPDCQERASSGAAEVSNVTTVLNQVTVTTSYPSSSSSPAAYSDHFDYRVLMVKRSSKSKFMPNAYVFPGGVVAEADTSGGWLEVRALAAVVVSSHRCRCSESRASPGTTWRSSCWTPARWTGHCS